MRIDEEHLRRTLHNFKARFQDRYLAFERIVDTINGREDWANLSPNAPLLAPSPTSQKGSGKTTPESKSTNPKFSISAPPSPYQPTVEDVEDDPDEEPQNVQHHYVRPDKIDSEMCKDRQKTPPVLVVRAPTDGLEDLNAPDSMPKASSGQAEANDEKGTGRDPELEQRKTDQNGSPKSPDLSGDSQRPPKVLTRTDHDERPLEDIESEIIRLQAELDDLALGRDFIRSNQYSSIGLDPTDDYPYPTFHNKRHRAFTTPGGERPSEYLSGAEAARRIRTPKASPRDPSLNYVGPSSSRKAKQSPGQYHLHSSNSPRTPQSAVEFGSSPWIADTYDEDHSPKQKTDRYGVDPRRSDPVVSRSGGDDYPPASGSMGSKRPRRYTDQFHGREEDMEHADNDWLNTQDGRPRDFVLFGPSSLENEAATGSSRRPRASHARDSYGSRDAEAEQDTVVEKPLPVTLEEMFCGTIKKLRIQRPVEDPTGRRYKDEERILEVPIYRGLKPGSKIKFSGQGGILRSGVRQDLHFIVIEKPHPFFTLRDRDLHCVLEIPLIDSLLGWQRMVKSICGKQIKVSHQGPTPPNWQECFAGLGMCSYKDTSERGDLLVGVKIKYPTNLSERQRSLIREALQGK